MAAMTGAIAIGFGEAQQNDRFSRSSQIRVSK
jgi:hypothetical protein